MLPSNSMSNAGVQLNGDVWEFVDAKDSSVVITSETESSNTLSGTASLKNKKKRDQKKKKQESSRLANHNKVTFGTAEELLFTRDISYDAIPSKGAYPLGLGDFESRVIQTVDDYCAEQQQNLRDRSASFETSSNSSPTEPSSIIENLGQETFESRQYDYKRGKTNQLFEPTSEEERLVILGSFISSSGLKKSIIQHENEAGSSSVGTPAHPIADLNRDVRNIRATRDLTGCTCKALKVDKLSVIKMKTELSAHGHLVGICSKEEIEKLSKTELTSNVKEMLKLCELCVDNNCECVQLGVPCSAEVCGCLRHNKKCANPEGVNIFNSAVVKEYRRNILIDIEASKSRSNSDIEASKSRSNSVSN